MPNVFLIFMPVKPPQSHYSRSNFGSQSENKLKEGLKIAAISKEKVKEWFARSLTVKSLLANSWRERYDIKIKTHGTCSANSFLHALSCQYIDDERFRNSIDERIRTSPDADLERFIAVFAQGGVSQQVYRLRRELLSKTCFISSSDNVKFIRCASTSIQNLIQFVGPLFSAMTSTSSCKCQIVRKFTALPVDCRHLRSFGRLGIQRAIDKRINGNIVCKHCGQRHTEIHEFGDIVFINVGPPIAKLQSILNPRKISLTLKGQKYNLVCMIDRKRSTHSAVSCLRKDGKWYHYDDNLNTVKELRTRSMPNLLVYRKAV